MLNGSRDISQLPLEWQGVVSSIIGLKLRVQWGVQVLDKDLTPEQQLAIECFQEAINRKRKSDS